MNSINFFNYLNKARYSTSLRVMFLTFIGMLLALGIDILMAARLGISQTTDALIIALSLPRLIDTVSRDGTKFSLVPLFIERRNTLSEKSFQHFVSGIINMALALGILVTLLLEVLASEIVTVIAPGLSSSGLVEATFLFRACAPIVIFAPTNAVLSVLLNSQKRFYGVALRNAIAPGFMLAGFGLAWGRDDVAFWVVLAYVFGFGVFCLTLFIDAGMSGYKHSWKAWSSRDDLSRLWEAGFLPTLGFIVGQVGRLISRQVLVSFAAVGAVSTFYFAVRLVSAAQSIIGVSIATTSLPTMTEHEITGQKSRLASLMQRNIIKVLLVSIPAVIFIV
ncbi:MAG: lipid II flippase MurJ, partial [Cyanobacteria bacterium P01_A01_bin.83]